MYEPALVSHQPVLQRASGVTRASFRRRGEKTVLERLRQEGCLKLCFPRVERVEWMTAVTLNTSGGIAPGDALQSEFRLGPRARATITAQAAERFYRALPGSPPAHVRTRIAVEEEAAAEWLPQDSILFDRSSLDRRLEIDLSASAWFLGVESLVFGRAAMGERIRQGRLRDAIRIRRGGELLLHDVVRLDGAIDAALQRPAIGGGAGALATIVHAGPNAETMLERVREAGAGNTVECGASAWNGMLLTRILASDAACLRRAVAAKLAALRASRPLPRVWFC
jgi:urease accessory protein